MQRQNKIPCVEDNRVIIRIWTSRDNKNIQGQGVGHVSIETNIPQKYMSFWPVPFTDEQIRKYVSANKLEQDIIKYFQERGPHYMRSYNDDYSAEGMRPPELTICLYGLSSMDIISKFEEQKKETGKWRLIGDNLLVQLTRKSVAAFFKIDASNKENCASFAYRLLKSGGLYKDLPSSFSSKVSSVTTPDNLAEVIIEAKRCELKNHPETNNFHFEGETEQSVLEQEKCCVM